MPSEYMLNLCFIRPLEVSDDFSASIDAEMHAVFNGRGDWYADYKTSEELRIAVVEINGLSTWKDESEALQAIEGAMSGDCWDWLQGYTLRVVPKEDVGPCCLKPSAP